MKKVLPKRFIRHYQQICRLTGKNCAETRRYLLSELAAWRAGDQEAAIPGYDTPPPDAAGRDYPWGWSSASLCRYTPGVRTRSHASLIGHRP